MTHQASPVPLLPEPDEGHPSEYALLLHLAEETEVIAGHLSTCASCRARVATLQAERAAFPAEPRFERTLELLATPRRATARHPGRRTTRFLWAFAATAAAVLVLLGLLWSRGDPADRDLLRLKGPEVLWVVERGGRQQLIDSRFSFQAGDQLGLAVDATRPAFARVLTVDEHGEVRVISGSPVPVAPDARTTLPFSLRLEAPLRPIRIFVVLTDVETPSEDPLRIAAEEFGRLHTAGRGLSAMTDLPLAGRVDSRLIE